MPDTPDFFRNFGILPYGQAVPPEKIRSYLTWGHVVGQYIAIGLMLAFGLGMALLFALALPLPTNVLATAGALACVGALVYLVTRNDYTWVELDGHVVRAKHLYTRRVVERPIEDVKDLLTLVIQIQTLTVKVVNAWMGRIRGVEIRFRDRRSPIRISRVDPAMKNAKELVEALIYRMGEKGPLGAEIIHFYGKPLVRRIFWKDEAS